MLRAAGAQMEEGELAVVIRCFFKGKARGDVDNYAGAVLDAANGILFADDKQVKYLEVELEESSGRDEITLALSPFMADHA
jgi:Holliday junction resolvase RusA-like endonuclease